MKIITLVQGHILNWFKKLKSKSDTARILDIPNKDNNDIMNVDTLRMIDFFMKILPEIQKETETKTKTKPKQNLTSVSWPVLRIIRGKTKLVCLFVYLSANPSVPHGVSTSLCPKSVWCSSIFLTICQCCTLIGKRQISPLFRATCSNF